MLIEQFPTARLVFRIEPVLLDAIDKKAVEMRATRSHVCRALMRHAVEQLRCSNASGGQ